MASQAINAKVVTIGDVCSLQSNSRGENLADRTICQRQLFRQLQRNCWGGVPRQEDRGREQDDCPSALGHSMRN